MARTKTDDPTARTRPKAKAKAKPDGKAPARPRGEPAPKWAVAAARRVAKLFEVDPSEEASAPAVERAARAIARAAADAQAKEAEATAAG